MVTRLAAPVGKGRALPTSPDCPIAASPPTLRHPIFPAASLARIVTVFDPTNSGTVALHCVVPDAVPAPPVFVAQVTVFTPTLSLAVPLNASDDAEVETDVDDGIEIVSAGGVVSPVPVVVVVVVVGVVVVVVVAAAAVRVTTAVCETCVTLSLAVTVIVFDPIASGRFIMLHALPMIAAVPEDP